MDRLRCALIIPALNEARTIAQVVRAASAYGVVVVVDDGSTDATAQLASEAGAQVVRRSRNGGYDAALDSGFAHAAAQGFGWAITLDADGQHNPKGIEPFLAALDRGAELVVGRRDRLARWSERAFAAYGRWRYGLADPLCGMKAYNMRWHRELGYFDRRRSIGTHLSTYAIRQGARWTQVDVATRDRADAPRFGGAWRANLRIIRALALDLLDRS